MILVKRELILVRRRKEASNSRRGSSIWNAIWGNPLVSGFARSKRKRRARLKIFRKQVERKWRWEASNGNEQQQKHNNEREGLRSGNGWKYCYSMLKNGWPRTNLQRKIRCMLKKTRSCIQYEKDRFAEGISPKCSKSRQAVKTVMQEGLTIFFRVVRDEICDRRNSCYLRYNTFQPQ